MENYNIQTTTNELKSILPAIKNDKKQIIFKIANQSICDDEIVSIIGVKFKKLPETIINNPIEIVLKDSEMLYKQEDGYTTWNLNFADPHLVGYYDSYLFAQDEIQVAEHPYLASCRKLILQNGYEATTIDDDGFGSPILFTNIPRMCKVKITDEIYGKNFEKATDEMIEKHIFPLHHATLSNIVAICSLSGFEGYYTSIQIGWLMANLYGAFTKIKEIATKKIIIETGYWGCGAFGGNKVLMIALQYLVAKMVGIDKIIFHTISSEQQPALDGIDMIDSLLKIENFNTIDIIYALEYMKFVWGRSDMN